MYVWEWTKEQRNRQGRAYNTDLEQKVKPGWINRTVKWEDIILGWNRWEIYKRIEETKRNTAFNKRGVFS